MSKNYLSIVYTSSRLFRDLPENGNDETKKFFDDALKEHFLTPELIYDFLTSYKDREYDETNIKNCVESVSYFMYDIANEFGEYIVKTFVFRQHRFLDQICQYPCIINAVREECKNSMVMSGDDLSYVVKYVDIYTVHVFNASYVQTMLEQMPTFMSYACPYLGKDVRIDKFDINSFCENPLIFIFGQHHSGKRTLCGDILKTISDVSNNIVISPEEYAPFYRNMELSPKCTAITDYDCGTAVNCLLSWQNSHTTEKQALVMDRCISKTQFTTITQSLRSVFLEGASNRLSRVCILNSCWKISDTLKTAADYIFLLKTDDAEEQRMIYDYLIHNYCVSMFHTFAMFQIMFSALTVKYGCMVLHNSAVGNPDKKIFWYYANP